MKKIYLVIALLAATCVAQARELRFYIGDEQVTEGSTVVCNDNIDVIEVGTGKDVTMAPDVYLWSDLLTNSVKLTLTSLSGQEVQCCAGGLCVSGTNIVKENVRIDSNEKLPLEFEYMGFIAADEEVPTIKVLMEAVDVNNTDANASFTIVLNDNGASVAVVENDKAFQITSSGIAYNINGSAKVALYTITGKKALETAIDGNGVLSTAGLTEGLYIFSIEGAQVKKSGKIYVF